MRALAASFATQRVGATTCLYRGIPTANLVSRLGALQIEDVFIPSVLVATMLGELRFCLGATMAIRRGLLEEIGGLRAVGGVLADDHALGERVTERKFEIELSRYVVRTTVPETSLPSLWSHELRWARTNFALAPAGYAFSFLIYALPLPCSISRFREISFGVCRCSASSSSYALDCTTLPARPWAADAAATSGSFPCATS